MNSGTRKSLVLTFALLALALPALVSGFDIASPVNATTAGTFRITLKVAEGKTPSPVPIFSLTATGCSVVNSTGGSTVRGDGKPYTITASVEKCPIAVTIVSPAATSSERFGFKGPGSAFEAQVTITAGRDAHLTYYHQLMITYTYANADPSSPTPVPPVVRYTQLGRQHSTPSLPYSDWTDVGTTSTYTNPIFATGVKSRNAIERWFASPSSFKILPGSCPLVAGYEAGFITCTATYYHEFLNTYTAYAVRPTGSTTYVYTTFDGGVRIPVFGQQGGNDAVVCTMNTKNHQPSASCSGWTDSGTAATFSGVGTRSNGEQWVAWDVLAPVSWTYTSAGNKNAADEYYQQFLLTVREHFALTFSVNPPFQDTTAPYGVGLTQWVNASTSVSITGRPTGAPCDIGSLVCALLQWKGLGSGSVTTCSANPKAYCSKKWSPFGPNDPSTTVGPVSGPITETEVFSVTGLGPSFAHFPAIRDVCASQVNKGYYSATNDICVFISGANKKDMGTVLIGDLGSAPSSFNLAPSTACTLEAGSCDLATGTYRFVDVSVRGLCLSRSPDQWHFWGCNQSEAWKKSWPPNAQVMVCVTDAGVTSNAVLQYFDPSTHLWTNAASFSYGQISYTPAPPTFAAGGGSTICGIVPLKALTGTNLVVAMPTPSTPPSPGPVVTYSTTTTTTTSTTSSPTTTTTSSTTSTTSSTVTTSPPPSSTTTTTTTTSPPPSSTTTTTTTSTTSSTTSGLSGYILGGIGAAAIVGFGALFWLIVGRGRRKD